MATTTQIPYRRRLLLITPPALPEGITEACTSYHSGKRCQMGNSCRRSERYRRTPGSDRCPSRAADVASRPPGSYKRCERSRGGVRQTAKARTAQMMEGEIRISIGVVLVLRPKNVFRASSV